MTTFTHERSDLLKLKSSSLVATVLGSGVSALVTALILQRHNFQVTIIAPSEPDERHSASLKAGAHWYSFADRSVGSREQRIIDKLSFQALLGLAVTEPDSGVFSIVGSYIWTRHQRDVEEPWFSNLTPNFKWWTSSQIDLFNQECASGLDSVGELCQTEALIRAVPIVAHRPHYQSAFSYETVMIRPVQMLQWLRNQLESNGAAFIDHRIQSESEALMMSPCHVLVNCCGLGAKFVTPIPSFHLRRTSVSTTQQCTDLNADQSISPHPVLHYPIRGFTIIVQAPQIDSIWRITDQAPLHGPTYILPRGDGTVVLGGTYEPHEWRLWSSKFSMQSSTAPISLDLCHHTPYIAILSILFRCARLQTCLWPLFRAVFNSLFDSDRQTLQAPPNFSAWWSTVSSTSHSAVQLLELSSGLRPAAQYSGIDRLLLTVEATGVFEQVFALANSGYRQHNNRAKSWPWRRRLAIKFRCSSPTLG